MTDPTIARAQKKSDFEQKAGHFHDLAGRGTSGKKKAGLSRQKRDGWQVWLRYAVIGNQLSHLVSFVVTV